MDHLPVELIVEITMRVSINDISAWCRIGKCYWDIVYNQQFWRNYIGDKLSGNQELLHTTFIELARQGDFMLFYKVWRVLIFFNELGEKRELIKEQRSLASAFIVAYNSKIADKIWALQPMFSGYHFLHSEVENKLGLRVVKALLTLQQFASSGDKRKFKQYYQDVERNSVYRIFDIITKNIEELLAQYAKDFDFLQWGVEFILRRNKEDLPVYRDITLILLKTGRTDILSEFIIYFKRDFPHFSIKWPKLLESSNPTSIDYLNIHLGLGSDPTQYMIPLVLKMTGVQGLGNRDILLKYIEQNPDDYNTLLKSGRTLEAREFINLLKLTMVAAGVDSIDEFTYNNFITDCNTNGRDYLSSLFYEEIPYHNKSWDLMGWTNERQ